jgi:transcriptional regulator of arginine metabolism
MIRGQGTPGEARQRRARVRDPRPVTHDPPPYQAMANKRARQATVRELIEAREVGSQEELRKLLRQRGWDVTQATLSRDLRELGVARVSTPEGARYTLSTTPSLAGDGNPVLEAVLPPLFSTVDGVGEMVVIRTVPGGAQPIARAIDAEAWPDILGTLAGDDTILLICRSAAARERLVRRIRALAGK